MPRGVSSGGRENSFVRRCGHVGRGAEQRLVTECTREQRTGVRKPGGGSGWSGCRSRPLLLRVARGAWRGNGKCRWQERTLGMLTVLVWVGGEMHTAGQWRRPAAWRMRGHHKTRGVTGQCKRLQHPGV